MPLNSPDWPDIDPGEFRHQITLLEPTTAADVSGVVARFVPGSPAVRAFAKKEYLRATDLIKAGQAISQVFLKLTMWYRPEFALSSKRIQDAAGKQFIVQAVENVAGLHIFLVLTCLGIGENN